MAKYHDLLPLFVVLLVFATAILTIFSVNAIRMSGYGKIGLQIVPMERIVSITDENGVVLGGKKAAIQFAYNLRQKAMAAAEAAEELVVPEAVPDAKQLSQGAEETVGNNMNDDILDQLSLKVASEVIQLYENMQRQDAQKAADKEKLLGKISKFGHFGTSVVKPLNLDFVGPAPLEADAKLTGSKRRSKRAAVDDISLNGNPLVKFQQLSDDPFRFFPL